MEEHALVILLPSEHLICCCAWRSEIRFWLFHQNNGMTMKTIAVEETKWKIYELSTKLAERRVKWFDVYNKLLTNDDEEKQFLLQVVEANQKAIPTQTTKQSVADVMLKIWHSHRTSWGMWTLVFGVGIFHLKFLISWNAPVILFNNLLLFCNEQCARWHKLNQIRTSHLSLFLFDNNLKFV